MFTINDYHNSYSEREVLFEKYNPFLNSFLLSDLDNWNYPSVNLESVKIAVENLRPLIEKKALYGEFEVNHYEVFESTINLSNVSHSIDDVFLKDRKIYGIITVLDTPSGKTVKELIKNQVELKFAVRATGNANNETTVVTELITWDIETRFQK